MNTVAKPNPRDLTVIWIIYGTLISTMLSSVIAAYYLGDDFRQLGQAPVVLRSILYVVLIVTFPFINLLRFIMLRLNQTMPGIQSAKVRYLYTVLVSLTLAESFAVMGLVLYFMGDTDNTLFIYSVLSLLAMLLYRPKYSEYQDIVLALQQQ